MTLVKSYGGKSSAIWLSLSTIWNLGVTEAVERYSVFVIAHLAHSHEHRKSNTE